MVGANRVNWVAGEAGKPQRDVYLRFSLNVCSNRVAFFPETLQLTAVPCGFLRPEATISTASFFNVHDFLHYLRETTIGRAHKSSNIEVSLNLFM